LFACVHVDIIGIQTGLRGCFYLWSREFR
jgi:hypothetical protein